MEATEAIAAPNFLDRAIAAVAPVYGLRRAQARAALGMLRRYEAASVGRRTEGWNTASTSAMGEITPALARLRDRSRDLVRNNAWAGRAIDSIATNVVGTGIIAKVRRGSSGDKAGQQRLQQLWNEWADNTICDAGGQHNFYALQHQALREVPEAGEVLIRRIYKADPKLKVPIQLQVLEADHLDATMDGRVFEDGSFVVQGIHFERDGRRRGYYLWPEHPGDSSLRQRQQSVFVPASDVRHIYRADRSGQVRGVPWGSGAMLPLRDYDEVADAILLRQKIANCLVGFVHDIDSSTSDVGAPDPNAPDDKTSRQFKPGMWQKLGSGKTITFSTPPGAEGFRDYSSVTLHQIAAAYGVTYEELTGDMREANFSQAKLGERAFNRRVECWRWLMVIPQLCIPIWDWWIQAARESGQAGSAAVKVAWTPPKREVIDPQREIPALVKSIRAGLKSRSEAVRELGWDPEELEDEIEEEQKRADAKKLEFDSDGRLPANGPSPSPGADASGASEQRRRANRRAEPK